MPRKGPTSYKLQINELRTISVTIEDEPSEYAVGTVFTFNINVRHGIDAANKNVHVIVTVQLFEPEKPTIILSRIQVLTGFHLPEYDSFMQADQKDIPDDLRNLLYSISISTTRGVLYSALRGSYLEKAIIPIVNPQDMEYAGEDG